MSRLSAQLTEILGDIVDESQLGEFWLQDDEAGGMLVDMISAKVDAATATYKDDARANLHVMFSMWATGFAVGREFVRRGYELPVEPNQKDRSDIPDSPDGL